jgi:hypothetical protein
MQIAHHGAPQNAKATHDWNIMRLKDDLPAEPFLATQRPHLAR